LTTRKQSKPKPYKKRVTASVRWNPFPQKKKKGRRLAGKKKAKEGGGRGTQGLPTKSVGENT